MRHHRGIWFPEGDDKMIQFIEDEIAHKGAPEFYGACTFQIRKLFKAMPFIKNYRYAVDVGAHVGLWSRVFARMFIRVDAFEPIPEYRECFLRNIDDADLRRTCLHPVALGEKEGSVDLDVRTRFSGGTHIMAADEKKNIPGHRTITAEMKTLDSFDYTIEGTDLLKIDVEGYEKNVLLGGEKLIRKYKPLIIVEQKPNNAVRYGFSETGAVSLLVKWGYKMEFEWSGDYCMRWGS